MSTRACENGCGRPAAQGWGICRGCHRRAALDLSDLADSLTAELEVTLTGQGRIGPDRVGGRSATIPLPFDVRASAVLTDVHARMVGWCLLLRDEAGATLPSDSIHDMSMHLLGWLDWLAKHQAVSEFVAEVASCVSEIERAVDLPPTLSRVFVGQCVDDSEDGQCPGELWARFPRDEEMRPAIECNVCEAEYEPERWNRLGERMIGGRIDKAGARRLMRAVFGVGA